MYICLLMNSSFMKKPHWRKLNDYFRSTTNKILYFDLIFYSKNNICDAI